MKNIQCGTEFLDQLKDKVHEQQWEIERLNNGCKELEQQIDDLHKLETTLTNENDRLNNIISNMEEELMTLYLDIMEYNEDYAKREIKKLKGADKECK